MKTLQINVTCGQGSTGKICLAISKMLNEYQVENYVLYSEGNSSYDNAIKYTDNLSLKINALKSRLFGNYGFNSAAMTKKLIGHIERISPDAVHLHNLHGHGCNLEMLFSYLRKKNIRIIWTFHDCWAFTGYCPHFDMIGCSNWQSQCGNCPQKGEYSWFSDKSSLLYNKKKNLLSGLDMTIITPSQWLAGLVGQSFLSEYPVKVINNGIDTELFSPTKGDFIKKYHLEGKKIVLGVAYNWDKRKGIDVFRYLAESLGDGYSLVLVGCDEALKATLPKNVVSLGRTDSSKELAEIYTAADVFVNATREENFPTVNIEALACGTPVVTFATGGSGEMLSDKCGITVAKNDNEALKNAVELVCENKPFSSEDCISQAAGYKQQDKFREYMEVYFRK